MSLNDKVGINGYKAGRCFSCGRSGINPRKTMFGIVSDPLTVFSVLVNQQHKRWVCKDCLIEEAKHHYVYPTMPSLGQWEKLLEDGVITQTEHDNGMARRNFVFGKRETPREEPLFPRGLIQQSIDKSAASKKAWETRRKNQEGKRQEAKLPRRIVR
jgi:hypothetical protein